MQIEKLNKLEIFQNEKLLNLELLKNQGFNNISYLLKTNKNFYIIRVFKSNSSVNISRHFEFITQKKAFGKNLTSKTIFFNENFLIYEFIRGEHKTKLLTVDIKNLASKIKKLHSIKTKSKSYNLANDLKEYEKNLKDRKSQKQIKESFKSLSLLKKYNKDLVLTHHDLNPKNIIFSNQNIKIIDWEYAGLNDRFFDLASICIEFSFNQKSEKLFLKYYFKNYSKLHLSKLKNYKIIYKNICDLWFMKLKTFSIQSQNEFTRETKTTS